MIIIRKDTEQALYQDLKSCWETLPMNRCLHLQFSRLDPKQDEWFDLVLDSLRQFFDDQSAKVYLCHDEDIFVLTRPITQKRTQEFFTHLSPKLAPASLQGLATLFEIGVDWPKLRVLCEQKITDLKIFRNRQKTNAKGAVTSASTDDTLNTISKELIQSLSRRRADREEPQVMIAEDDPFSQKLVGNALKGLYPLCISSDGRGAVMNYVKSAPDVLFLDIGLPDMSGHDVLKRIFQIDPEAYVVMFSGNGDKDNVMKAVKLGAKGFVGKPFTREKILQYIEKSPFIQQKKQ